jgi:hypothetical protein
LAVPWVKGDFFPTLTMAARQHYTCCGPVILIALLRTEFAFAVVRQMEPFGSARACKHLRPVGKQVEIWR